MAIGKKIVEGPLALHPPIQDDDFGWLECDFRIVKSAPDYSVQESIAIYTDNTLNREEGFLKPVIRKCIWQRKNDIYTRQKWPTIEIELGYIDDIKKISEILIHFQSSISKIHFAVCGVSLARDVAEIECKYNEVSYFDLFMRNGVQAMTYSSCDIKNDGFSDLILRYYKKIFNDIVPFEKKGWRERFEYNLKEDSPWDSWEWNYEA